ncbi:MAG: ferrous iron transport protein A [Nitrososphaerota archaeon]
MTSKHHSFPLSNVKEGSRVRVVEITGGRGLTRRLMEIGILPGTEIEVVKNNFPGPVIIKNETIGSICIGYGMASKIIVEVV